jgi:hypothetical protein
MLIGTLNEWLGYLLGCYFYPAIQSSHSIIMPFMIYSSHTFLLLFLCSSSTLPTISHVPTQLPHTQTFSAKPGESTAIAGRRARSTTEVLQSAFSSPLKTLESFQDLPLKTLSDLPCQAALNRPEQTRHSDSYSRHAVNTTLAAATSAFLTINLHGLGTFLG